MSSQVIYIKEVDISDMKPVTLAYFCENTGVKRGTAERWVKNKKILTDKKTGRVLFTEIFKFKKHD